MNPIIAIDPGTTHSAWVEYHPKTNEVYDKGYDENNRLLGLLGNMYGDSIGILVVEGVANYGSIVGASTFDTVWWSGRFAEAWVQHGGTQNRIMRRDIMLRLTGKTTGKDANIRQALIDRFPPTGGGKEPAIGTKSEPGPLYGVSKHIWSALAVAVAWDEYQNDGKTRWNRYEAME